MPTLETLREAVEAGNLDRVEEHWLELLEARPLNLDRLRDVATLLTQAGQEDTARMLLGLAEDQLASRRGKTGRLDLLRVTGALLWAEPAGLHDAIVETLRSIHGGHAHFEALALKTGLHRAPDDIPKTWQKVDKLLELLAFEEGTIVWMEGKGAGRVVEVNVQLDRFKVDLDGVGAVGVGFAAAKKMLQRLEPEHVLRRKIEDPESLRSLKVESPADLVRVVLESYEEPLEAKQIRETLSGVVDASEWSAFWSQAKKSAHLMALPGGRQTYRWAASAGAAVEALGERFHASSLGEKLDLLRTHEARDPELRREMIDDLRQEAEARVETQPNVAFAIAVALEQADADLAGSRIAAGALLASVVDPVRFLRSLGDRALREEMYLRWPRIRDDWAELYERGILEEDDRRLLDTLADRLRADAPDRWRRVVGELLTKPRQSPAAFAWLAERAANDDEILARSPARLFQQILAALADDEFRSQRRRLLALTESGKTLARILPHLDADQAARAEGLVLRSAGLGEHEKSPLLNAIRLRFPELHAASQEVPLYALPASIDAKREELRKVLEEEIPANRKAIEEARELGDLRENFEYKSARQRHEYLTSRAENLHRDLERTRPIDLSKTDPSAVRIGTRVRLDGPGGATRELAILGPWESDPEAGVLSSESELAQTLLGLGPGDTVQMEGGEWVVGEIGRVGE